MSYSNRIWMYGPVGLLLLAVVLFSVFWRVQADTLAARLDRANGGEIVPGVVFAFAEKSITGYPFRLDVVLSGVTFVHRAAEGEMAWRTEKLAIHFLSYNHDRYIFETTGLQSFARPGAPGAPQRVVYVTPAIARASAVLNGDRIARFDLDLWQPQAKDASLNADPNLTLNAQRAQLHLLERSDNTVDVAMKIEEAQVGAGYRPALGSAIKLIELRGKLVQGQTLDNLRLAQESVSDAIDQWRQQGGTLAVESLALDWAGMNTTLVGTISLDAEHRPAGALVGAFDPAALVASLSKGGLKLTGMGQGTLSLTFKDGDVRVGVNSGGVAPAR
ncbi:MAG TPA: DUF2125 domain-containing protein [Micropepsaceae bacterium]|nr:DUF2125 domain-containing protein [Micropepsaceae bacterium]